MEAALRKDIAPVKGEAESGHGQPQEDGKSRHRPQGRGPGKAHLSSSRLQARPREPRVIRDPS